MSLTGRGGDLEIPVRRTDSKLGTDMIFDSRDLISIAMISVVFIQSYDLSA